MKRGISFDPILLVLLLGIIFIAACLVVPDVQNAFVGILASVDTVVGK